MSHHGREGEDDRVEYINDSPKESLKKALVLLGATLVEEAPCVRTFCVVDGVEFHADASTAEKAFAGLLRKVAAAGLGSK